MDRSLCADFCGPFEVAHAVSPAARPPSINKLSIWTWIFFITFLSSQAKSHLNFPAIEEEITGAVPNDLVWINSLLPRHHHELFLWNRVVGRLIDAQMRHDQFRRRVGQPLRERHILIITAFEHFQEDQV